MNFWGREDQGGFAQQGMLELNLGAPHLEFFKLAME
jgi:hypothetical protein